MSEIPYGITVFCDDIRHEINGKMMLIGCYSAEMNFNGPAPGVLPTFGALVNVRIPKGIRFGSFVLKVFKDDRDGTVEMFSVDAEVPEKTFEDIETLNDNGVTEGAEKVLSLSMPVQWSPLVLNGPGMIRVRVILDTGQEIRAGSLKINFSTSANPDDQADEGEKAAS